MATCGTEEQDGSCVPSSCCSTVHFTFTDETFLNLYFGSADPVTAVFAPHPTSPIIDFREVYMWQVNYIFDNFANWFRITEDTQVKSNHSLLGKWGGSVLLVVRSECLADRQLHQCWHWKL